MHIYPRSDSEVDEVQGWAVDAMDMPGMTRYPGMTYEQGIDAALAWITGQTNERPDSE